VNFPPRTQKEIGGGYLVLKREPMSPMVTVILPNQDSYSFGDGEELEIYLKMLEIPEDLKIRDYVWNFFGCKIDLTDMSMEPLSYEQASAFLKRSVEVAF